MWTSGHGLPPLAEPPLHRGDLVLLRVDDAGGEGLHRLARAALGSEAGHDEGLGMVADHARHEVDVGLGERRPGTVLPRPVKRLQLGRLRSGLDLGLGWGGRLGRFRPHGVGAATGRRDEGDQDGGGPLGASCSHASSRAWQVGSGPVRYAIGAVWGRAGSTFPKELLGFVWRFAQTRPVRRQRAASRGGTPFFGEFGGRGQMRGSGAAITGGVAGQRGAMRSRGSSVRRVRVPRIESRCMDNNLLLISAGPHRQQNGLKPDVEAGAR